jgi:hypothetical protein
MPICMGEKRSAVLAHSNTFLDASPYISQCHLLRCQAALRTASPLSLVPRPRSQRSSSLSHHATLTFCCQLQLHIVVPVSTLIISSRSPKLRPVATVTSSSIGVCRRDSIPLQTLALSPPTFTPSSSITTIVAMATNELPRRVSMGWVLGLSKKGPFKDAKPPPPPRPPKPNEYVKMVGSNRYRKHPY